MITTLLTLENGEYMLLEGSPVDHLALDPYTAPTVDPITIVNDAKPRTIRQKIIDNLYAMLDGQIHSYSGEQLWNNVLKDNLEVLDATQLPAVAIEEGPETTIDVMWPLIYKTLTVYIGFRFSNDKGIDVYDTFNYYLAELQKKLLADKSVGGIAIDIHETGNQPQIVDRSDPRPGGNMTVDVHYRHINADPYNQNQ